MGWKISCKAFIVKKSMQQEWLTKNAYTALKKLPAPLASEKKTELLYTNRFLHPPPRRYNGPFQSSHNEMRNIYFANKFASIFMS